MKFRKKPVVIEAVEFTGDYPAVSRFMGSATWCSATDGSGNAALMIPTLEGEMLAQLGDWIIKGVKGEFYPCRPDIFAATYETVE